MKLVLDESFSLGAFNIFPSESLLEGPQGRVTLSPIATNIIVELAAADGGTLSAEKLVETVWGDQRPSPGTLEFYVAELTQLLNAPGAELIVSDGTSYRLTQAPALPSADESPSGLFAELQRRKVTQTGALYLVAAWLIIQVADVVFPALGLGDNAIRIVVIASIVGFPITLVLSWFYDVRLADQPAPGEVSKRRLSYVVAGALIAIPLAVGYQWLSQNEPASVDTADPVAQLADLEPNSIAVLSFLNLGSDNTYDYFSDGIAEEILNSLSSTGKMLVAPRTSSFSFKDSNTPVKEIGAQLGVRYVLDGSVRRNADRVRVSAQLINVVTGYAVWSNSYDQLLSDIFGVQQDISQQVVRALDIVLTSDLSDSLGVARTANIDAYDYYLQGRDYMSRPTSVRTLSSASQLFNQAIELDPEYSDAYAGLCESYILQYIETNTTEWFDRAEQACKETLRFDFVTVNVRVALGNLYRESGQHEVAREQLAIALQKSPDNIAALSALAKTHFAENNPAAAEELFRRAIEVQPRLWKVHDDLGSFLFRTARYGEAVPEYQRAVELTPDNAVAYNNLGVALFYDSKFAKAAEAWQKSLQIEETESASSNVGSALFFSGQIEESIRMYARAAQLAPDRHILWGNLAYAERFGPSPDTAMDHYRRAITLAEDALSINPSNATTMAFLGLYYSGIGQAERARELIEQATSTDSKDIYVWFNATLVWLSLDNKEVALQSLQRAIELGYPTAIVPPDKGLEALTSDARYRELLGL